MDRAKRLAVLLHIHDGSQEALRSAVKKGEISAEDRSELVSRLGSIQREIDALEERNKPQSQALLITE